MCEPKAGFAGAVAVALLFVLLALGSVGRAQGAVYTCGPDYSPVDIAFGPDGTLYSSDPRLLELGGFDVTTYYLGELNRENLAAFRRLVTGRRNLLIGSVYRHDAEGCTAIAQNLYRPFGLTFDAAGQLCVSHFLTADPMAVVARRSAVSCWDGREWTVVAQGPRNPGYGFNDLVAGEGGLLAAAWESVASGATEGYAATLRAGTVAEEILLSGVPHFLLRSGDELLVTTFIEALPGGQGGLLIRLDERGQATYQDLLGALRHPSGLVSLGEDLLVADYVLGRLVRVAQGGTATVVHEGLEGPMGMRQAPNGNICIAEMRAGRITCLSQDSLTGDGQTK